MKRFMPPSRRRPAWPRRHSIHVHSPPRYAAFFEGIWTEPVRYRAAPFRAGKRAHGKSRCAAACIGGAAGDPGRRVCAARPAARFSRLCRNMHRRRPQRMGNARGRDSQVPATLEDLKKQGLLVSEAEFLRLASASEAPAGPLKTIGIPARKSSALIERCVRSYAAHARQLGREIRFAVAGSGGAGGSRGERVGWLDQQRVEAAIEEFGRAGIETAIARFALTGAAEGLPPGIARTTGANRNVLLLATQGEAFLSVDDDTLCGLLHAPQAAAGIRRTLAWNTVRYVVRNESARAGGKRLRWI